MKKFFIGIAVLLAAAIVAVCTLDVGTGWLAQKGAEYVANTYNLGVSIGGAKGNPVKGYTFNDIELTRDGTSLIKAGKIFVDPALLKLLTGNVALDLVELGGIKSTIPHLLQLAEIFTGRKVTLPSAVPLNDLQLNSVGGTLDGFQASGLLGVVRHPVLPRVDVVGAVRHRNAVLGGPHEAAHDVLGVEESAVARGHIDRGDTQGRVHAIHAHAVVLRGDRAGHVRAVGRVVPAPRGGVTVRDAVERA